MASGTWTAVATTGNWNLATLAPWNNGLGPVADGATFTANFTSNITATTTVTLTEARTIGNITFSDNGVAGSAWTLAGASNLTLDNGGGSPVLTTTTAATISAPITGTAGFTKEGTGTLTLSNTAGNTGLTGPVTINAGQMSLSSGVLTPPLSNAHAFSLPNAGAVLAYYYAGTAPTTVAAATTYAGDGVVQPYRQTNNGATTIVFPAGAFTLLTGTAAAVSSVPQSGLSAYVDGTSPGSTNDITVQDLPSVVSYRNVEPGSAVTTTRIRFSGAGAEYGTRIDLITAFAASAGASTQEFYANNASGLLKLTGGVTRAGIAAAAAMTLTLRGTGAGGAELSGIVAGASLAITKADTNKWILSGANTYTGTTTISAGTLAGNSTSAFGSSTTGVISQTGGTLEFGAVVNKGTLGVTLVSAAGADAISSPTGTTGLTCGGATLNSTIPVNVAAGTFTLTNSAAMSGATFGITKTGAGEFVIASTANNAFTGAVSVSAGTLTIISAAAPSAAGPLGNAATGVALTGTMKYAGTGAATISRSMTLTGAAPAFEAAGTTSAAAVTFSAFTHAAGARTVTFKGANAGDNTFSAVLNDNGASAVGLTKSGAGKWILSAQPTYTGLTTVSAGELQFNELNLANNLTVNGTGKLSKTVLNGSSKAIACDGGTPEIVATTLANTVSGTTSVTAGTLRLTTEVSASSKPVTVLGTTDVTVSASAAIRTSTGNTQRGQMRYGGNLTFGANSSLYIGG